MILVHALVVAAGGALGVAARLALELLIPDASGIPIAVLIANIAGAFGLGVLVVRIPAELKLRLFLGTGLLGGFTTYSALAIGTVQLWEQSPLLGVGYAVGSLVLGIAAALAGLSVGRPRTAASS